MTEIPRARQPEAQHRNRCRGVRQRARVPDRASWQIAIGSGPGLANSKIRVEFVGSGKLAEPSTIVLPAATVEKLLPSASLALSINGTDYITNKNIISVEFGGKNNIRLDDGFYPDSGFQEAEDATKGVISAVAKCGVDGICQ